VANPAYTEHDYVLKSADTGEILSGFGFAGLELSRAQEAELCEGLEKARREDKAIALPALNLTAGWDEARQEYYAVVKNRYDPRNLLDMLYDRLLWDRPENPEDEARLIRAHIDNYLGVIEKKEKVSLAEAREKLTAIALDMRTTIAVYEDGKFSDEDIEGLSDSFDRAYFNPITELLEGIIIAIAGN
jgi:hypothetical protein